MPKLTIDDQEIEVEPGTVIIQACEQLGIEIPRFCYHERLAIAGNCRMCLVEVSPGPPKPQASCALPCADGQVVKTNSEMVKKAREGVMEFLLINHPLDCPICDQGGECDLQDQSIYFGKGESRYKEHKRSVEDKYMGPLVKTYMNRCIHCTRCVRFIEDVAGVPDLGGLGRGGDMEIGTYVEKAIGSELSGNIVDLCPVGALTSKPYAFVARPWELTKTESIDVLDAVGSNIRIDSKGEAVLRVLPRVHDDVNEEWLSDKSRHACDGLRAQRLDKPYLRNKEGKLEAVEWSAALAAVASKLTEAKPSEVAAIAGNLADVESMFALKELLSNMGVEKFECRQEGASFDTAERGDYLFNTGIANIEHADAILLVGANPRTEAALINARIRKAAMAGAKIFVIGEQAELTYPYEYVGNDLRALEQINDGSHPVAAALKSAERPAVIIGQAALARQDGLAVYSQAKKMAEACSLIKDGWNGFNVLHHAAARVGALDIGFAPKDSGRNMASIVSECKHGDVKLVYLLGVDEIDMSLFGDAFKIYQGHHGDIGAHHADIILPGAAYAEKDATYVNTEGRVQLAKRAVFAPGGAREDWTIIRAISDSLSKPLPFDNMVELRSAIVEKHPALSHIDEQQAGALSALPNNVPHLSNEPLEPLVTNFYMTDPISRASKTMAECSSAYKQKQKTVEAA